MSLLLRKYSATLAVLPVGVLRVETKATLDPAGVGAAGLPEAWLSELELAQACR